MPGTNMIKPLTIDLRVDFGILHCFLTHLYPNHLPHPLEDTGCDSMSTEKGTNPFPDGLIHTVVIRVVLNTISVYFLN